MAKAPSRSRVQSAGKRVRYDKTSAKSKHKIATFDNFRRVIYNYYWISDFHNFCKIGKKYKYGVPEKVAP